MDIHYNAFISYRHHPDDIRVAEEIHKGLERFKTPRAIKKRTGGAMRLFRDKEELPITSHLTDDIYRALENSDFLIVICSPHTKESVWVQREIETFLRTHSRDKVLTVLAEGEPYDVIPDILLHEDVVDPITGQIRRQEIEPLSCDWRMKKRKAIREELPRLAAPLLHCAYDELRQRQRQYRMRRTVAAFSAALAASLGLTVYFINTSIQIQKANDDLSAANEQIREANVQIQDNLDEALRNQSQYLASSSQERMEAGDRLTALALAMEALPGENDGRPYVAAAERALSDALGTYDAGKKIVAQGAYMTDNLVKDFKLTQDGQQIYILDARNVITVWDVKTFRKLHTVDLGGHSVEDFYITPQGNILCSLMSLGDPLCCFDLEGRELWQTDDDRDIAFLDQGSVLMVLCYNFQEPDHILFLNPDTGEQVRDPIEVELGEEYTSVSAFLQKDYLTGQPLILRYSGSDSINKIVLVNMESGELLPILDIDTSWDGANQWIDAAAVVQDNRVVIMCGDGSGMYNGSFGNMEVTSRDRADLWCYDSETGKLLWESEIVTYVYSWDDVVAPIPDSNWVLLQSGNTFMVCDSLTGEIIAQCETVSQPLSVAVEAAKTTGMMENGDFYSFRYAEDECSSQDIIDGAVDMAVVNRGCFVHAPLERQVTAYWYDDEDAPVPMDCEIELVPKFCQISGDNLVINNYDELVMMDIAAQKQGWVLETGYGYESLGLSADGSEFWMWNKYDEYAAAFSVADGTQRTQEIPMDLEDLYTNMESNLYMQEDRLFYILKADGKMQLLQVDLQTGEVLTDLSLDDWILEQKTYSTDSRILLVADRYVWVYRVEGTLSVIDLESGSIKLLAENLLMTPPVTCNEALDQVMVGVGHEVYLTTTGGRLVRRLVLGERKAVGFYFYQDQLLVLGDDGDLYRFDRLGKLLSQTTMNIFNTFAYDAAHLEDDPTGLGWWVTEDGNLIVNIFGAGNIVDCSSWQSRAYVPELIAYAPEKDTLLCVSGQKLHAYPRYTTHQLMERAREELGDFRLSEEVRNAYGLNEEET